MLHLENDYNKGIHPQLLQALVDSNQESLAGYGMDSYCAQAVEK
ncbi:low specificity L-threonine aldolase, partial [Enterococcus gallinarum]